MDSQSLPQAAGAAIPSGSATVSPTANPSPPPAANNPSYEEMIFAAITALKTAGGSTRKEIAGYIQQNYDNLAPNHSLMLTRHLQNLKASRRLLLAKNAYRLPEPGSSSRPKRGRPAKGKNSPAPKPEVPHKPVVLGLSDDEAPKSDEAGLPKQRKRGRGGGRPAKKNKTETVEKAPSPNGAARLKRARGRPTKVTKVPFAKDAAGTGPAAGPPDQPKVGAPRAEKLPVRRRGRSGKPAAAATVKPVGQPSSSGPSAVAPHGFEYEILQKKVGVIQGRIMDAVAVLKPHLAGEASSNVMAAIIELEAIAAMDVKAPPAAGSDAE